MHEHREDVLLIDVREEQELRVGELGLIPGSRVVPLSQFRERLAELPKDRPVVTTCPAGARSAQAALILEQAGFDRAANLPGGLFRWQAQGLPTQPSAEVS